MPGARRRAFSFVCKGQRLATKSAASSFCISAGVFLQMRLAAMTRVVIGARRRLPSTLCLAIGVAALTAVGCAASAQERLIVALGDSNTQGVGVPPQQAYPARLEA